MHFKAMEPHGPPHVAMSGRVFVSKAGSSVNRLSEGGATVTSLAREIGLQIPHASAELRNLEMRD